MGRLFTGVLLGVVLGLVLGVLLKTILDVRDPDYVMQVLKEVQLEEERILLRREVHPSHAKEKIKLRKRVSKINKHAKKHAEVKKGTTEKNNTGKKQKKSEKLMKTATKQNAPTCSSTSSKTLSWMAMKTASQIRTQVVYRQPNQKVIKHYLLKHISSLYSEVYQTLTKRGDNRL